MGLGGGRTDGAMLTLTLAPMAAPCQVRRQYTMQYATPATNDMTARPADIHYRWGP
jgi:hypothetical protein